MRWYFKGQDITVSDGHQLYNTIVVWANVTQCWQEVLGILHTTELLQEQELMLYNNLQPSYGDIMNILNCTTSYSATQQFTVTNVGIYF